MEFEKSQTKKNLETALQGEALAHLKYQFYKKGITNINEKYNGIFDEIIHNEKEHGKIWFKLLHNKEVPSNEINLIDAIKSELKECTEMYTEFGRKAKEEGFEEISNLFYQIAKIECNHHSMFKEIKKELQEDLFKSDKQTTEWKCLNCGHIVEGYSAPNVCPVCEHPQKYFIKM